MYHFYLFFELQGFLDGSEEGYIFFDPVIEKTEELILRLLPVRKQFSDKKE